MKNSYVTLAVALVGSTAAVAISSAFVIPERLEASPAFAQKVGASCASCHSNASAPSTNYLTPTGNNYKACLYNPNAQSLNCDARAKAEISGVRPGGIGRPPVIGSPFPAPSPVGIAPPRPPRVLAPPRNVFVTDQNGNRWFVNQFGQLVAPPAGGGTGALGTGVLGAGGLGSGGNFGRPAPVPAPPVRIGGRLHSTHYNFALDAALPGQPERVTQVNWPGVFSDQIDAAFNEGATGKAFFFKGSQFVRYDIRTDRADTAPTAISATFQGVWPTGIDAVFNDGRGKLFFFKGNQYIRFDLGLKRADPGYPKFITNATWPGLQGMGRIDSAAVDGNGKVFFFSGSFIGRYDITRDRMDPGFPRQMSGSFASLMSRSGISAAVHAPQPGVVTLFHRN